MSDMETNNDQGTDSQPLSLPQRLASTNMTPLEDADAQTRRGSTKAVETSEDVDEVDEEVDGGGDRPESYISIC